MNGSLPSEIDACLSWYRGDPGAPAAPAEALCRSRDAFEGRLSRLLARCERLSLPTDSASLLVAILGEIGNNAFDHNLGHWIDDPGCWFGYELADEATAWVADRGRGILASLSRVVAGLNDHQQAIEIAFERTVSGRAPEQRGNGLKFVRRVVNGHPRRGLLAVSGRGAFACGGLASSLTVARKWPTEQDRGMLVVVRWSFA